MEDGYFVVGGAAEQEVSGLLLSRDSGGSFRCVSVARAA
jgi:hypothetical protein